MYTNEELLKLIKKIAKEIGRNPKMKDLGSISHTMYKRFGSWNNAIIKAGLTPNRNKYTDEDLIEMINRKAKELGKTPFREDLSSVASTIVKRFGSWNNAIIKAGLTPNRSQYTDEDLIEMIKKKSKELGRTPFSKDLSSVVGEILKRFGSWNNAIIKAGLTPNR